MHKFWAILVASFSLCCATAIRGQDSGRIKAGLFDAVVQIETPRDSSGKGFTGTGFLATPGDDPSGPIYLVTNKHMVGKWECPGDEWRDVYDWIDVKFYRTDAAPGQPGFRTSRIALRTRNGIVDPKKIFAHADKNVDIAAVNVDSLVRDSREHIRDSTFGPTYFVKFDQIDKQLTGVGDLVFALGYPLGIASQRTNHPIAKAAYLASIPGEEVSFPYICKSAFGRPDKNVKVEGKILVIDGLIVHGNSGSPVVLAGGTKIRHDPITGQLEWSTIDIQNLVTGIVASGWDGAGLTLVYSSDYILDLLDQAKSAK